MIRLYIDKNVLSNLKLKDVPKYLLLSKKLADIKPYATVIFSRAHISDLSKGYDENDEIIKSKTQEDLELLSDITENQCLISVLNEANPRVGIKDPIDWFNEFIEDIQETKNEKYDLVKEMKGAFNDKSNPLAIEANNNIEQFLNAPSPTKILKNVSNPILQDMLGNGETMGETINHFMNFITEIQKDPKKFKALNKHAKDGLKLGQHISQIKENIFQNLDVEMNRKNKMSLTDMLESTIQNQHPKGQLTNWNRFSATFSLLNTIGYKTDNLEKGYNNYQNDIEHSFMAAHCDFFITEDDKTYSKAKAIYEKENLSTKVCKVDEFMSAIEGLQFVAFNDIDFSAIINKHCVVSNFTDNYCVVNTQQEVLFTFLEKKLFNYFNYISILTPRGKEPFYKFSRKVRNYSNFIYYGEIAKLTDLLINSIGSDMHGNGYFNLNNEKYEIDEGKWKGRHWILSNYLFSLSLDTAEANLCFTRMSINTIA